MPRKPARPCRYPGCPNLTDDRSGYCWDHLKKTRQQYDNQRGTSTQRGYDARWRKYRAMYLAEHPLCKECLKKNMVVEATVVDHIIPHRGDYNLFWDPKNHQPLCETSHNIKTATVDGAFGNQPRSNG
jgi:5-methylcytosine-specific restriction protein A